SLALFTCCMLPPLYLCSSEEPTDFVFSSSGLYPCNLASVKNADRAASLSPSTLAKTRTHFLASSEIILFELRRSVRQRVTKAIISDQIATTHPSCFLPLNFSLN